MTYLEKFKRDHPDKSDEYVIKKWWKNTEDIVANSCPSSWGYEDCSPNKCNPHSYCKECWNREIPNSTSWVRGEDGVVRCGGCKAIAPVVTFCKGKHKDQHITPYCPWCGSQMNPGVISSAD